jgi:hypothetical protein
VEIPWPGLEAYLDYRLGLPSTPEPADPGALRDDVARTLAGLPAEALTWRPELVIALGTRPAPRSGASEAPGQHAVAREAVAQLG